MTAPTDQERIAALETAVAELTTTNAVLTARVAELEAPPVLPPAAVVPSDQRGLPIPPKRSREPEHAPARTGWGDLGLFDPTVGGLVETITGELLDPNRLPTLPSYLDRLQLPDLL